MHDEQMLDHIRYAIRKSFDNFLLLIKWLIVSLIIGIVVGSISTAFAHAMQFATSFRSEHLWMIFGLPLAGVLIVFFYHISDNDNDRGTNMILSSIESGEEVRLRITPLIIASTILSHLFGASVGREGAALQLGGSLGDFIGRITKRNESDKKILVMCGMSAAFAALFGTPMAAAIFAIEVVNVGVMYYVALVPAVFSALVASQFAAGMGIHPESFTILAIPEFDVITGGKTIVLAVICALVSIVFCMMLHASGRYFKKFIKNPYLRVITGSVIIILLTILVRCPDYMGAGIDIIARAIGGEVQPEAFVLKMIFTALAIGCGFKGGEIVPSFYVGATLGCLLGQILGLEPSMAAAVGMVAMFCGVTNCPVSSTLIAFELFGYQAVPFFLIGNSVSYLMSGYYGLYKDQLMTCSKSRMGERRSIARLREERRKKAQEELEKLKSNTESLFGRGETDEKK